MTRILLGLAALLTLCASVGQAANSDLRVNEFMADNETTILDEAGDSADWVEIYNSGASPVLLTGMFLTDDPTDTYKWVFPDTLLLPDAYLIVWCDGEEDEGPLHASFSLNDHGEFVGLYESVALGNGVIDSTSFGHQADDVSYGRYPNGEGSFGYMPDPTPLATNQPFGNVAPFFFGTTNNPLHPNAWEPVTVTSLICDDSGIAQAKVFYHAGDIFEEATMYDDGQHGDGAAGDGIFGALLPGKPEGTTVLYYIWAEDDSAATATDPAEAPAVTFNYGVGYVPPTLFLNELMAMNETTIADEYGEFDDWLEIYNGTQEAWNLAGFHISDERGNPDKFALPDVVLEPGEFLLVWCDEDGGQGPLHANFKLGGSGEFIGLFERVEHNYAPVDTLTFGQQATDVSYGRVQDGEEPWVYFVDATPGTSNHASAVEDFLRPDGQPGLFRQISPIRDRLKIAFRMPADGMADLRIFDISGRSIANWTGQCCRGEHEVRIGFAGEAAGVYLLQLRAAGTTTHGRIVLVP